ncbi:uncharacterized protein LOC134692570 [Mytilus trossulus]|uniref:uncharacterized protein LOC134692570 n=1 Tax=Mytilus trossulus TaxID=6551 RepID=UPI0030042965
MGDVDNPFQQLEDAKKQLIMDFKENAKSVQELEFWNRMESVRDNYPNSQEDSSSGDTTDEEQVEGVNLTKGKKTDEKVPDTSVEETIQQKSAAGERADEEKTLREHTESFHIPEMEHGAGDDTHLLQKDFIFQNDGVEHDFSQNATRDKSLINLFENGDSNGLGALQLTEDKLEINETENKNVSAEKANGCKVGIKDLFKAAKKTAKMEAKESEKKRKLKEKETKRKRKIEARETERKRKLEENESKKKMKIEAQVSMEEKTRELDEYESKQKRKDEKKSSQGGNISDSKQFKQKQKIDQNDFKENKPETNDKKVNGEHTSFREKPLIEIEEHNGKVAKEKKELKAKKSAVEEKVKTGVPGVKELNEKLKSMEFKEKIITDETKPVNKPKLMDFVRSLVGFIRNRY